MKTGPLCGPFIVLNSDIKHLSLSKVIGYDSIVS